MDIHSSMYSTTKCLVTLVVVFYLISCSHGQIGLQYSFEYKLPQECTTDLFYNSATFQCESCRMSNTFPSTDKLSCVCMTNAKKSFEPILDGSTIVTQLFSCTLCTDGEVVSRDQSECIVPDSTCPSDSSIIQRDRNGTRFADEQCLSCEPGTSDSGSTSNSACTFCPTCTCTTEVKDGVCVKPDITPDLYQTLDSWWMRSKGLAALYGCSSQIPNITACQMLSNMCTALVYNQAMSPCTDYARLYAEAIPTNTVDEPRTTDMPWLYYVGSVSASKLAPSSLLELTGLPTRYSFSGTSGETELNMVASKYDENGQLLGFENVATSGTIQLCPNTKPWSEAAFRFGTRYESPCSISAASLWDRSMYPVVYYELFIEYEENGKQFLYPIPVLITNMAGNDGENVDDWTFVRRFAMVDSLVGVDTEGGEAKYVRVASDLLLKIKIRVDDEGHIFVPYLAVTLKDVSIEDQDKDVDITFQVSYVEDSSNHETVLIAYMTTVGCLTILWSFFELGGWRRREGLKYVEGKSFFMLIMILCANLANIIFVVIFSIIIVRFIVFKGQDTVTTMAPKDPFAANYLYFLCFAFGFKTIEYIGVIFRQSSIDIFFIDWEKSKADFGNKISGWRTYFVANEFNELQTIRKTSLALQLFLVLFFLEVVGLKSLALEAPTGAIAGVYNKMFRFALLACTYMLINLVQVLFNYLIYTRMISDPINEFVDLCSVCNVSMLLLVERQHGYYIHGRSVHGTAETDMYETAMNLNKERENLTSSRGLENGSSLQTFHISIPSKFRYQYDKIYFPLKMNRGEANSGQGGRHKFSKNVEITVAAYTAMRNFLISFFDHTFMDMEYFIKDRLFFEVLFDMEFQEPIENAVIYNDPMVTFDSKLFYGREFLLMTFEILLITMIDYGQENFVLACILTYFIQMIMVFIRQSMAKNNLVRKTLVDERFLL